MFAIPLALGAAGAGVLGTVATGGVVFGVALGTYGAAAIGIGLSIAGTLAQVLLTPQPPKPSRTAARA